MRSFLPTASRALATAPILALCVPVTLDASYAQDKGGAAAQAEAPQPKQCR